MKKINRKYLGIIVLALGVLFWNCTSTEIIEHSPSGAAAPDHTVWTSILKANVTSAGNVNYAGIKADTRFSEYIELLSSVHPDGSWSKNERKAFWINAYNAFTVKLINDNMPLKSIKDISGPWKKKFIKIENATYSLSDIEHEILRKKYDDPRIHFAINCASISCPKLVNKAFASAGLEAQLDKAARGFVNDPIRNKVSASKGQLSEIFKWFKSDFTKYSSLKEYVNKYAKTPMSGSAKIEYLDYNWNLNK